ncbi:MAG TPA: type II secretion system protein [Chthoniobacter sp.]|jgi:prepilin-type N-terminal cleavage/methylation domain-containing protein
MKSYRRFHPAAFTLVEIMVAIGMFGIAAAASIEAMLRMNLRAALCRLQTGASTLCQNQIDLILSDSPFNPQNSQTPPELTLGTTNTGSATAPSIAVYTDPISNQKVLGWMTTTVANTNSTENSNTLYVYQITVTVYYYYKGKEYSVTMSTMRASDV